jgi:RND family efflux transporter MFP subunit
LKSAIVIVPAILVLLGCSKNAAERQAAASAKPAAPPEVRAAVAEIRRTEKAISVTGSLDPDETVTVSSEVSGRVVGIFADFGQRVTKGQIVAELDKREFKFQLDRARAAMAQALARVGLSPSEEEKLPETTPAIRQAQAQLEDAKFKYESAARLVKTGDISQERYTELEKAYRARQAASDAAGDELRTQLASIQALRAEVHLAEKRLSDATLRAPFDGAVSVRMVSAGQYIKDNTPILSVVKTYPLRLRVEIPEAATGAVRLGTSLTITTEAVPGAELRAVVRELNPTLDSRSRSLTAEARLVEHDPRLRPGMFVQVRLVVSKDAEIVVVPRSAVYTVAGLSKVFVLQEGKAVEKRVVPGIEIDGWVEVPGDGIRPGDPVAVSHVATLTNGMPVRLAPAGGRKG